MLNEFSIRLLRRVLLSVISCKATTPRAVALWSTSRALPMLPATEVAADIPLPLPLFCCTVTTPLAPLKDGLIRFCRLSELSSRPWASAAPRAVALWPTSRAALLLAATEVAADIPLASPLFCCTVAAPA